MEHAPIYRSTTRRTSAAPIPWQRTASLASAAVALTVSGIALGYHGFSPRTIAAGPTPDAAASGNTVAMPVPSVAFGVADGGHPDVMNALSAALITRFEIAQAQLLPVQAQLPVLPQANPVLAPPQPTAEAFVLPATALQPLADATEIPVDLQTAATPEDVQPAPIVQEAPAPRFDLAPLVTARVAPPAGPPVVAADEEPPSADAAQAADPQDQVAAAVQDAPPPAPAQAAPSTALPAPARVATAVPVVHKATPVPEKPELVRLPAEDEAPPVVLQRSAPHAQPQAQAPKQDDASGNGNTNKGPQPSPAGPASHGNNNNGKGKGGGSGHGG